jgi:translation initiation factor IF-1
MPINKSDMSKSGSKAAKAKKAASRPLNRVAQMKARKNAEKVQDAVNGDAFGVIYGRVEKHFGCSRIQVLTADTRLHQATIRNILRNKRATRIEVNDVVMLAPRDFETTTGDLSEEGIATDEQFDVIAVLDRKSAKKLVRAGEIPSWMPTAQAAEEITNPKTGGGAGGDYDDECGFEFDYESEDEPESDDEDHSHETEEERALRNSAENIYKYECAVAVAEGRPVPEPPAGLKKVSAVERALPPSYEDESWARKAKKNAAILPNGEINIDAI